MAIVATVDYINVKAENVYLGADISYTRWDAHWDAVWDFQVYTAGDIFPVRPISSYVKLSASVSFENAVVTSAYLDS